MVHPNTLQNQNRYFVVDLDSFIVKALIGITIVTFCFSIYQLWLFYVAPFVSNFFSFQQKDTVISSIKKSGSKKKEKDSDEEDDGGLDSNSLVDNDITGDSISSHNDGGMRQRHVSSLEETEKLRSEIVKALKAVSSASPTHEGLDHDKVIDKTEKKPESTMKSINADKIVLEGGPAEKNTKINYRRDTECSTTDVTCEKEFKMLRRRDSQEEVLGALRSIADALSTCQSPGYREMNKSAELCNSLLQSDSLSDLQDLSKSNNEPTRELAKDLIEKIVPIIWH